MKSKIALPVLVGLSVLFLATLAVAQAAAGNHASTSIAVNLEPASATDGAAPPADFFAGASVGSNTGVADAVQIRQAVDKFKFFFELQDADLLKSEIWPSISPRAYSQLKNTFKALSQISLQENCPGSPVIVSDSAEWTCTEQLGYEVEGKPRPTQTHALQFHLKKVEGKWYVEGRTLAGK